MCVIVCQLLDCDHICILLTDFRKKPPPHIKLLRNLQWELGRYLQMGAHDSANSLIPLHSKGTFM